MCPECLIPSQPLRLERCVCSCLTVPLCPSPPVLLAPRCLFPFPPIQFGPQRLFMYLPLFVPKYMFPLNQYAFHCFPFAPKCPFSLTQSICAPLYSVCTTSTHKFGPQCLWTYPHLRQNVCFPLNEIALHCSTFAPKMSVSPYSV